MWILKTGIVLFKGGNPVYDRDGLKVGDKITLDSLGCHEFTIEDGFVFKDENLTGIVVFSDLVKKFWVAYLSVNTTDGRETAFSQSWLSKE